MFSGKPQAEKDMVYKLNNKDDSETLSDLVHFRHSARFDCYVSHNLLKLLACSIANFY